MNSYRNDQLAGFFFGIAAVCGITLIKLYSEYRKVSKRIERNEAFLAESEALKRKYPNGDGNEGRTMAAELIELMNKYGL